MKCAAAISLPVVLLALMPAVCHAQEFSADVVYANVPKKQDAPARGTAVPPVPSAKLYVSKDRAYFQVADAENACPDWQKAVGKEITCEKVGNDIVDGRKAVEYRSPTPNGAANYVWVDTKLNYVIKWIADETDAELRNIAEGPQSADLFAIPQGYEPRKPPRKQSRTTPRPR